MTTSETARLRQTVRTVLQREAGKNADAKALATTAFQLYERLTAELTPLIGRAGIEAITARGLHLAQREFPCLAEVRDPGEYNGPFARARLCLEQQQDVAAASDAATATLATFAGLLVALIGPGLTSRLLQAAWSTGFPGEDEQEALKK